MWKAHWEVLAELQVVVKRIIIFNGAKPTLRHIGKDCVQDIGNLLLDKTDFLDEL